MLVLPLDNVAEALPALSDLAARLPLIRYSLRSVIGQQVERWLRHVGLQSERRFEFDATDPLLSLVAAGLGWAVSTPLCLWQSRHFIGQVAVYPLPASPLGQRDFYLLGHQGEWSQLGAEVARVTRQVMRQNTMPDILRALPTLGADAFDLFD